MLLRNTSTVPNGYERNVKSHVNIKAISELLGEFSDVGKFSTMGENNLNCYVILMN